MFYVGVIFGLYTRSPREVTRKKKKEKESFKAVVSYKYIYIYINKWVDGDIGIVSFVADDRIPIICMSWYYFGLGVCI